MWTLADFNRLDEPTARAELLACCASPQWVEAIASQRPFPGHTELLDFADKAYAGLDAEQISQAVKAHPAIGTRSTGKDTESAWSRQEQSAASESDVIVKSLLAQANQQYRRKFGQVFLICATGLNSEEILAEAQRRFDNDPATESAEVATELRKIVQLRLTKLVSP